jgi:hypothetical protein
MINNKECIVDITPILQAISAIYPSYTWTEGTEVGQIISLFGEMHERILQQTGLSIEFLSLSVASSICKNNLDELAMYASTLSNIAVTGNNQATVILNTLQLQHSIIKKHEQGKARALPGEPPQPPHAPQPGEGD